MKLPIISNDQIGNTSSPPCATPVGKAEGAPSVLANKEFAGNVAMVTLGCAKNVVDSEVMLGALRQRGFRVIDEPEHADLIVVNTCAFLQAAVEEGVDRILEMARLKQSGRCKRLVVAGCMVERYREDLQASLPEVDRFVSTDELLSVGDEVSTSEETFKSARRPYFLYDESMPRVRSTLGHTAYVKISEGCDRPCSFCIIPRIRGGFRSRTIVSVVSEIESLVVDGVKEINLVAQDLTSYGIDLTGGSRKSLLIELLNAVDLIRERTRKEFWTRLLYAYPIGVTDELVRSIFSLPAICNYLDLPLQHISHSVLKRMNRPLGEKGTRALIENIRNLSPEIALRTTLIVGFPGETEKDVRLLEEFISEGHFLHVGVFTYSPEPESKACDFDDHLDEAVKEERRERLMEAQQKVVQRRLAAQHGEQIEVLVEDLHEESDLLLTARSQYQAPETDGVVIVNELSEEFLLDDTGEYDFQRLKGSFATAEITGHAGYDLIAKIY